MSTMTGTLRRMILFGVAGTVIMVGMGGVARADVASDQAGAILIFPKIVVDTSGLLGPRTDTEVQITNTSNRAISVRCFVVDDTSRCSNAPDTVCTAELVAAGKGAGAGGCPIGGLCQASLGVRENDFQMTLTKRQPIAFRASQGLASLPCDGITTFCANGQSNGTSSIPRVQHDPFIGEIKCVETDSNFAPQVGIDPINNFTGDLKGEATIISATPETAAPNTSSVDAREYNGIGIQSTALNNGDDVLQLGGDPAVAEYNGCPNILILDHFFDGAPVVTGVGTSTVTTDLTLVPCGEDFFTQTCNTITVQFLVFNEFEQRFSTSTPLSCFREVQLSNLDTRPTALDDSASIFNFKVQGTLSGQTRIRSVAGPNSSNTIIGVAEEFWKCSGSGCAGPNGVSSTAANLHFAGTRLGPGDTILLSPQTTE